jgi:hypothetical protein
MLLQPEFQKKDGIGPILNQSVIVVRNEEAAQALVGS